MLQRGAPYPALHMKLLHDCQDQLLQLERLLGRLQPQDYTSLHAHSFQASIGQHVRHCLNHFEQLLDGLPTGTVDYDSRQRELEIETLPEAALRRIQVLQDRFASLAGLAEQHSLRVLADSGTPHATLQPSSFGRELQFLISHTVHHFAIIAMLCRTLGIPSEPEFGIASSTLRYRAATSGTPALQSAPRSTGLAT